MVSTSLMVDTSSHPRAQLHRCVERSAYETPTTFTDTKRFFILGTAGNNLGTRGARTHNRNRALQALGPASRLRASHAAQQVANQ